MTEISKGGWKTCSRGHKYRGAGPCPTCYPGRVSRVRKWTAKKRRSN
jgi:hypothetical protein